MWRYFIKRILHAFPILIGVNIITFVLFFMVNSPDDMARVQLGEKHITQKDINVWKLKHGYDKPLFFNHQANGFHKLSDTLFYQSSKNLFLFRFGQSEQGRNIGNDIKQRMWPSLAIAVPALLCGLVLNITLALFIVLFRNTFFDYFATFVSVVMISISSLFYIIFGQYFVGKILKWVPFSGYQSGWIALKFVILPIILSVLMGMGASIRWYRTIFLEEISKDYVRTARAKGLSEVTVLFKHVLKNALIPILTGVVVIIPTLFLGSLILESFFGIPGLGSYTLEAIQQQDFAIVRAMVFLGTVLYILGLILTDLSYVLVDPRVRLGKI